MTDIVVQATISRANIAVPTTDLNLEDPGKYRLIRNSYGPGAEAKKRISVENGDSNGRLLLGATKDVAIGQLGVRVYGSSAGVLDTRVAALLEAFDQIVYTLTVTLDGTSHQWICEPADWALGANGTLVDHFQRALAQEWHFSIPHDPVPTLGAY